ncbi:MAG TPA: type II toxin-antitoxin system RelE/ParE family toxin [Thermoanaerobaculia bacterium]
MTTSSNLDFIARDSISYAAALSLKAEKGAASLDQFPNRGRVVPEYRDPQVREIPVGSYRLMWSTALPLTRPADPAEAA